MADLRQAPVDGGHMQPLDLRLRIEPGQRIDAGARPEGAIIIEAGQPERRPQQVVERPQRHASIVDEIVAAAAPAGTESGIPPWRERWWRHREIRVVARV